ncbi:MAG: DEAD/DEAH box helicase [Flavobacteriaceae bacterium]|nr:DEAD/DEAH box helicase [Flavobacteriaceae bacterium]
MSIFKELGLNDEIANALADLGYKEPTQIQASAIPQIIKSTDDLKAFAQTGTGKTAAFSLPILQLLDTNSNQAQAIILSPTRELAVQIGNNIREFAKYQKGVKVATVYGGASIEDQIRQIKRGAQIIVGTPGRTCDLIKRRALNLGQIQWLVLDEADEMLNMGFKEELDKILDATPDSKQTMLFSATFPKEVESIARNYMTNPVEITSGEKNKATENVSHEYYIVNDRSRYLALKRIADVNPDIYSIIFCRTRRETQEVADKLIKDGYSAEALHGDLSQAQRDSVMQKFRKKHVQILVATDVAARGLDVTELTHVINHKLPDQIESYTHRSGRTGRAGKKGISIALVTRREKGKLFPIEKIIGRKFKEGKIPTGEEICQIQLMKLIDKVKDIDVSDTQINEFLPSINEKLEGMDRDELIKRFVSLEFNTFLNYYKNAPDLNNESAGRDRDERGRREVDENMSRFFINIGRRDGLRPANLIGLINDQGITNNLQIGQIEILDSFSFFEVDKAFTEDTVASFQDDKAEFNGRTVNVEITEKKRSGRSGGGGGRSRGRREGGRDGGRERNDRGGDRRRSPRSDGDRGDRGAGAKFGRNRSDRPDRSDRGGENRGGDNREFSSRRRRRD